MFGKFRKSKDNTTIEDLINEEYNQQYFEECKYIWQNYVPKNGRSYVMQGELLRQIEKLRYEAQDNGNINWSEELADYCDYIKETLCSKFAGRILQFSIHSWINLFSPGCVSSFTAKITSK